MIATLLTGVGYCGKRVRGTYPDAHDSAKKPRDLHQHIVYNLQMWTATGAKSNTGMLLFTNKQVDEYITGVVFSVPE